MPLRLHPVPQKPFINPRLTQDFISPPLFQSLDGQVAGQRTVTAGFSKAWPTASIAERWSESSTLKICLRKRTTSITRLPSLALKEVKYQVLFLLKSPPLKFTMLVWMPED